MTLCLPVTPPCYFWFRFGYPQSLIYPTIHLLSCLIPYSMASISSQRVVALILEREFPTTSYPPIQPPTATLLVGHLVINFQQSSLASPDSWFINHFISGAGCGNTPGVGDHVIVYRDLLTRQPNPDILPAFSGRLTRITAWSPAAVEFDVFDDHVGGSHPRTICVPRAATRLSWG